MSGLNRIRIGLLVIVALSCACGAAMAQEFRGAIAGRVTEANGAAIASAQVTITNTATNSATNVATDDSGEYRALYLPPGPYTLTVEAKGFKKAIRRGIEVRVGDKLELNVAMEVGAVTESVNITADAPLLETNSASAGQV